LESNCCKHWILETGRKHSTNPKSQLFILCDSSSIQP